MKERAFILPAVILLLTLLMIAIAPQHDAMIMALRSNSEESLSDKAENQATNSALQNAINLISPESSRILHSCKPESAKLSRVNINKTFCASYHSANLNLLKQSKVIGISAAGTINLPSLNFEKFFTNPVGCEFIGGNDIKAFPVTLSKGSATSSKYCRFSLPEFFNPHTLASNLEITSAINIRAPALTVRGFMYASSTITITAAAKIIAAGDIYIEKIVAKIPSEVTLISASGDVRVISLSGPVTLKVFAAQRAIIPDNAVYSVSGFEDYKLDFLPLGFID